MIAALVLAVQCGAPAPLGVPIVPCDPGHIPGVGQGHMEAFLCPGTQELVLWAYLPVNPPTVGYFVGSQTPGLFAPPGHFGKLCLGLPAQRLTSSPVAGSVNGHPIHLPLSAFTPGDTWYFQCWWLELCNGTSAFTDGRELTVP